MTEHDPAGDTARLGRFHIIGLDHRTCPDPVRETLFVADEEVAAFLARLRAAGIDEAIALSTCDRVEVHAITDAADRLAGTVADALAAPTHFEADAIRPILTHHGGLDAVRHLFRVAGSLESQVVGEPQVLGQVRAAHRMAEAHGMVGRELERLYRAAYGAAKRVRSETTIAEGPTSLAAAAVRVARRVHGDLSGVGVVLVGTDDMALLLAETLRQTGVADIIVIDRNPKRADAAARDLGGHVGEHETRAAALRNADILIAASADGRYTVTEEMIRSAIRARRHKPMLIVDLAVPADVEPAVERVDEAFLYDLDDLERLALEGLSGRDAAVSDAEAIIEQDIARLIGDLAARDAGPLIRDLRTAFEEQRQRVLRENPGIGAEEATRLLTNRLLHRPSEMLRALAAEDGVDPRTETLIRAALVPNGGTEGEQGEF